MIIKNILSKSIVVSITALAALSLTLAACSTSSSSGSSSSSETANSTSETNQEGTAFENTYIIEGFTGAWSGSDGMPTPDAKMQTVPSIEVSYPTTWKIVETQITEYQESHYGTQSKTIVLEGPTGLQAEIRLAANIYGGAHAKDSNIEVIGATEIEGILLAWANTPEYGYSFIQYVNQKYIDEQENGSLEAFPSLAYLPEGTLNCSLYLPEPGITPTNSNRKSIADNADLDTAFAILESVRLA